MNATEATIETLQREGPSEEEVETVRKVLLTSHQSALSNNSSWMFWLLDTYKTVESIRRAAAIEGKGEGTGSAAAITVNAVDTANAVDAADTVDDTVHDSVLDSEELDDVDRRVAAKSVDMATTAERASPAMVQDFACRLFDTARYAVVGMLPEEQPEEQPAETKRRRKRERKRERQARKTGTKGKAGTGVEDGEGGEGGSASDLTVAATAGSGGGGGGGVGPPSSCAVEAVVGGGMEGGMEHAKKTDFAVSAVSAVSEGSDVSAVL